MDRNAIFPQTVQLPRQLGQVSYEKKCIFHERMLLQYLERKMSGWCVSEFFKAERIEKYALYAITDFTYLFLKDMEQNDSSYLPTLLCDKNAKKYQFKYRNWPIILPDEFIGQYKEGKIKKVVVMSVLHENDIIEELQKKGVLLNDLLSFVSILHS